MASIASVSQTELGRRRQQLRRQRRQKSAQAIWQTVAVSSLAGSLAWAIAQPIWLIEKPQQVSVAGNHLLSDQTVTSLLRLSYPQSVWNIQPEVLAKQLEASGPIAKASVTRNLFPPALTVEVQERRPVAIALESKANQSQQVGWLDANGFWMPLESYTTVERSLAVAEQQQPTAARTSASSSTPPAMPSLKIIGKAEQYRPYWPEFYQVLSQSPVKVFEIDWQDPGNLILTTELGKVHLGPYSPQLPEQLHTLDRMRQLPKQLETRTIAYIDLKNPSTPLVHLPDRPQQP
ncbi:MAG: cell division protein FtsQ/DivIB [Actinomycetota bacterium]